MYQWKNTVEIHLLQDVPVSGSAICTSGLTHKLWQAPGSDVVLMYSLLRFGCLSGVFGCQDVFWEWCCVSVFITVCVAVVLLRFLSVVLLVPLRRIWVGAYALRVLFAGVWASLWGPVFIISRCVMRAWSCSFDVSICLQSITRTGSDVRVFFWGVAHPVLF